MKTALLMLGALALLRCGPFDARCRAHPAAGADFGACLATIGAYYDAGRRACMTASGCGCDAACREQVPFTSIEECRSVCE